MNRITTLLALVAFTLSILAQSPDLMTYQAVLRDAENNLITNQVVAVQISILQGSPNGTTVFTEGHTLSTNANGLISLEIGDGIGDDLSTVDWSAGPYFIKTETDPAGGSNYTITSTSQLLSVPYAKYADEAGNAFSGAYGDLAGAPTNVSAFYNDAGYLTSRLWSRDGNDLYYLGGNIGIGTASPHFSLDIVSGDAHAFAKFQNNTTGISGTDGFLIGSENTGRAYILNYEATDLVLGTNNSPSVILRADGNVGIGTDYPSATLEVNGDARFGSFGVAINELREITGTTHAVNGHVAITLPTGYNMTNTRVLSLEIMYFGTGWVGLGMQIEASPSPAYGVSYQLVGTSMYIYYPNLEAFRSRPFRALIMQTSP